MSLRRARDASRLFTLHQFSMSTGAGRPYPLHEVTSCQPSYLSRLCLWCPFGLGTIGMERTGSKWKAQTASLHLTHLHIKKLPLQIKTAHFQLTRTRRSGALSEISYHLRGEGAAKIAKERAAQLQPKKENPADSADCKGHFGRDSRYFATSFISVCVALSS